LFPSLRHILIILFCILANTVLSAKFSYKPSIGDKFQYKISYGTKHSSAVFIYDIINKSPTFNWKLSGQPNLWGSWYASKAAGVKIVNNLKDTAITNPSNMLFISKVIYKLVRSGKPFKLKMDDEEVEFRRINSQPYDLPLEGAGIKLKILCFATPDHKWTMNVLDNEAFPLIVEMTGRVSWKLLSIVPLPMIPITHNIVGTKITDKNAEMFNRYIHQTCDVIEASYTEDFKRVVFNEYFCPLVGVRFSLKDDTIISLELLSNIDTRESYDWQTYQGYVWGTLKLGTKQKIIENQLGKPVSSEANKNYYPDKRFYLIYNTKGELETVEYQ